MSVDSSPGEAEMVPVLVAWIIEFFVLRDIRSFGVRDLLAG
jgi:hypothetical protein